MQIVKTASGEEINLKISGRVDTIASPGLERAIVDSFTEKIHITLDFSECEYISSAGLRALLIGHKTAVSKGGYLKLTGVSESVMQILKLSGFCDFLSIETE